MTPSARTSQGSVSPWPTSVARITQKVRKSRRSRFGVSSGSARAVASETTPRMPAQPMMSTSDQLLPVAEHAEHGKAERGRRDPEQADHDHHGADQRAEPDGGPERAVGEAGQDRRELEADQQEDQAVQREDQHVPDGAGADPDLRVHDPRRPPPEAEAGRDDREDAGDVKPLGGEVRRERGQQRDDDLDGRVGDAAPEQRDDRADGDADQDAAGADDRRTGGRRRSTRTRRSPSRRRRTGRRSGPWRR